MSESQGTMTTPDVRYLDLVRAAVLALTPHNNQPWRFEVDRSSGKIAIRVDETRDPSPMNCGQRMARIAVGAAAENILVVAEGLGWQAQLETPPAGVAAMVKVTPSEASQMDVAPVIRTRVTNRRVYDGRPVPDEVLAELAAETPADAAGVTTHWIGDRDRMATIATTVANSDGVMFGLREMLDAFLSKVRFDTAVDAEVDDGLSLASLEAGVMERMALRFMWRAPHGLLKATGAIGQLSKFAKKLVRSASGVCLVVAPDWREETDVQVGQAVQRAWLALARRDLASQPMMSGPVLDSVLECGGPELIDSLGREQLQAIRDSFRQLLPECGTGRVAWLMRFGYAADVSGRTGRLPWRTLTTETNLCEVLER